MGIPHWRESGYIRILDGIPLCAQVLDRLVEIERIPQDDHIDDQP